jgi:predicted ATP-dependent Lon-type protease
VIDQLEVADKKKDQDIFEARLENIKLRNKIRRQEQIIRQKEELGGGLHLIDFEQLKIENQAYNEKIEERNEVKFCRIRYLGVAKIEKENHSHSTGTYSREGKITLC